MTSKQSTVIIGLHNPKSPTNVGAVMRAAGCYNATQVRYSGTRYQRAAKFQTDTQNIQQRIELVAMDSLSADLDNKVEIVCVELVVGATALPEFVHPTHAMYLFGPEDGSLPQDLVDQAQHVVYVPTYGCMNLAATVNVVLYDRLAKNLGPIDDRQQVLANRDNKNRLKVKSGLSMQNEEETANHGIE
ncbi:RNA methyltransferase [Vibrio sp. HDW18]|uniref:RNA methyltransferase n=1 Tax=Vibrio sp. HDW18 TaxID=2714948 RepID=UPI00140C602F|nr:RNA methyltransferase [Vibrio sp. HDW18]QIL86440.1 RNA methyltransferase [Vibrio sp. HDW18]